MNHFYSKEKKNKKRSSLWLGVSETGLSSLSDVCFSDIEMEGMLAKN